MKTIKSLDVVLSREIHESKFYHQLLDEELQNILNSKDLEKSRLYVYNSYLYEDDNEIYIGIYLINTCDKDLLIKDLPLSVYNKEEKILNCNLEINKEISTQNAIFKELRILKEDIKAFYDAENISIALNESSHIKKYPYINVEVENIPRINGYKGHREIKKFLKNIPNIEENQLLIDILRVGELEEGFCIVALVRNSGSKELNIKSLPLSVYTDNDTLIYRGVYNINDNGLIVESNKGRFYTVVIPFKHFLKIEGHDLSKYTVRFE